MHCPDSEIPIDERRTDRLQSVIDLDSVTYMRVAANWFNLLFLLFFFALLAAYIVL